MTKPVSILCEAKIVTLALLVLLVSACSQVAALQRVQSVSNDQLSVCNAGPTTQCVYFEPVYTIKHVAPPQPPLPPNQPRVEAWFDGRFYAACNEEQGFCQFSVPTGRKVKFSMRCVQPQPKHELGRVFGLFGNTDNLRANTWGRFVVRGDRTRAQWGDRKMVSSSKPQQTYSKRQQQQLTIYCN